MNITKELKIGIAHWRIYSWGGAEYLVTKLAEVLGIKNIYTLGTPPGDNPYGKVKFYDVTKDLPLSHFKRFLLKFNRIFEYYIWESVDFSVYDDFDILISSGSTTRAIILPDNIIHVNYCHSPPRWLYDLYHYRIKDVKFAPVYDHIIRYLRIKDIVIDKRVDYYLANSPIIKRRIWKYYKRSAEVLYPPIEISKYKNKEPEDYYLYLGRLDKEKGIIEVVLAFKELNKPLKIVGSKGNVFNEVMKIIKGCRNIEYMGFVSEKEKIELLSRCKAVIFNAINEDFGIVPIEANASGKLCVSIKSGYPGIYIKDGINGFLHDGSVKGIIEAILKVEKSLNKIDPENIKKCAEKFDITIFKERLNQYINKFYQDFNEKLDDKFKI